MNTKVIFVAIAASVVLVGSSIAFAKQTSWQAPTKPFPDLGGIAAPLDEGGGTQSRAGIIDFSSMMTGLTPLQFSSGQNIKLLGDAKNSWNIFFGDFKIATWGNGIIFPDGSKQTVVGQSLPAKFFLGKLCQAVNSASTNTINAPDTWTASNCGTFATNIGATDYQLGCALPSGTSFGGVGGALPSSNCGWTAGAFGGLYYPYAPTGNPSPQKVIAAANQPSVPTGAASVISTPLRWVYRDASGGACVPSVDTVFSCVKTRICGTPITTYATALSCGAYVYDNKIDDLGTDCGTGSIYQTYCR